MTIPNQGPSLGRKAFDKSLDGLAIAAGVSVPIIIGGTAAFFGYGLVYGVAVVALFIILALWARTR